MDEAPRLSLGRTILYCAIPVLVFIVIVQLLRVPRHGHPPSKRTLTFNNLKQILIAIAAYHDVHNRLPVFAIRDKSGRPLLSWRVAILPYIEQESLYRRFRLDEPWDSPHNHALLQEMPWLYELPGQEEKHETYIQGFVGPDTAFEPSERPLHLKKDFPDGPDNTVMLVVADRPVPWTKPEDVPFHPEASLAVTGATWKRLGGEPMVIVGMADGAVRFLSKGFDEKLLRHAIIRHDGVGAGKLLD